MVKGNPKSSASSGTRKKHAKKHAPVDEVPKPKEKGRGKKKEPKVKMYIPPVKPAPVQPDPLETTGLAHTLPADLLVVLRNISKKAQVTKTRALEELQLAWVNKCLKEGRESLLTDTLVEMLPVWVSLWKSLSKSDIPEFYVASSCVSTVRQPFASRSVSSCDFACDFSSNSSSSRPDPIFSARDCFRIPIRKHIGNLVSGYARCRPSSLDNCIQIMAGDYLEGRIARNASSYRKASVVAEFIRPTHCSGSQWHISISQSSTTTAASLCGRPL
jgi:hypothetical protein